jgi:hypothetical protein
MLQPQIGLEPGGAAASQRRLDILGRSTYSWCMDAIIRREHADAVLHAAGAPVVVVGGTGVVGRALVELLRLTAPELPVSVAGRSAERARALQEAWPGLGFVPVDLGGPLPFGFEARAVVAAVNDPADRLLTASLRGGVPYVDITRWTARLQQALVCAALTPPRAPVLFSSAWMGGVVARVAAALAEEVGGADRIETSILYDVSDQAGDDAIEFMDRMWIPFEVTEHGRRRAADPLSEGRVVDIGARRVRVVRLDTPEQATLPLTLGAPTVSTRIGFTAASATWGLMVLQRLGVFYALRSERCRSARQALLKSSGRGGTARLRIDVWGPAGETTATLSDPRGQAHLTAVGALLGVRSVLGQGMESPRGVAFPEQAPRPGEVFEALTALGVEVERPREARREAA